MLGLDSDWLVLESVNRRERGSKDRRDEKPYLLLLGVYRMEMRVSHVRSRSNEGE